MPNNLLSILRLTCVIILLLITSSGSAQNAELDSLRLALIDLKEDSFKVKTLCLLANKMRQINADSTLMLSSQALDLAISINYSRGIATAYTSLGIGYHLKGQYDSAMFYYEQGMSMAVLSKNLKSQSQIVNNMGLIHWNRGNYSMALEKFHQSLELDEALSDESGRASSLNNIGLLYRSIKKYEKSLEYLLLSYSQLNELEDDFGMAQCSHNIGLTLVEMERYSEAIQYFRTSIFFSIKSGIACHQSYPLIGLADAMRRTNRLDSAVIYGRQVFDLPVKCLEPKNEISARRIIGASLLQMGQYLQAEKELIRALALAKEMDFKSGLQSASDDLYRLYKRQNRYREALKYHEIYTKVSQQLANTEQASEIARLEATYEFEQEKQQLISEQDQRELILQAELHRQKIIKYSAFLGSLLFVTLFINFYFSYKRKKRDHELIFEQKKQLEKLSEFKEGLAHMIAHDMKNSLNNIIAFSSMDLADNKMRGINQSGNTLLNLVTNMLDVQKFEETGFKPNYSPSLLFKIVDEALFQVQILIQMKSVQIERNMSNKLVAEVDKEVMVRVLVNLLTNAIKFSKAGGTIVITASEEQKEGRSSLLLEVSDEGQGIPEADLPHVFDKFRQSKAKSSGHAASTGLGLTFCKMAVEAHHGTIEAHSVPGRGTTMKIQMPVKAGLTPIEAQEEVKELSSMKFNRDELGMMKEYLVELENTEVYQIGKLKKILSSMEGNHIQSTWKGELAAAIQTGDTEVYHLLIQQLSAFVHEEKNNVL